MKKAPSLYLLILLVTGLLSCSEVMYTPRSKKVKLRERPSMLLCERIVDFRTEFGRWPVSREDIAGRGKPYYEVFRDFKYTYTHFKTIDSVTMVFTYSGHPQDDLNYAETNKYELNRFDGSVRFFKMNGKIIWKIKD